MIPDAGSGVIWCECGEFLAQRSSPGLSATQLCPVCADEAARKKKAEIAAMGWAS